MWPPSGAALQRAVILCAIAIVLAGPVRAAAEDPPAARDRAWGAGKNYLNYLIPALEVGGFVFAMNQFNRHFVDSDEYGSDGHTFWRNLTSPHVIDKDPFSINQIGHPYQGSIYYGFARSAGLSYWESLLYTLFGSFLWETYGETTPPSLNDHIMTGIGGSFVGESLFRMASLLLEGGGDNPGFWRELGAALLSPPTGFNRLVFGDRFDAIFPSRDPAVYIRLRLGATLTTRVANEGLGGQTDIKDVEGLVEYNIAYGLPGKPGYRYQRPFDYFTFDLVLVPNASSPSNAFENASIRGLLVGTGYDAGDNGRGLWGLFGSYDYLSPQIFRVSTAALSLGTVAQWWLSRVVALQGTALGGVGFGAAGTVADRGERDYHFGVAPQVVLGSRLIVGDRAMLEVAGRGFFVAAGSGREGGVSTSNIGDEIIGRVNAGFSVRLWGPHALGIQYALSTRDARQDGLPDRHQKIETLSLTYNFLGSSRFGAVEWRGDEGGRR
jgi:Domain of unknown function (DUF3943)